MAQAHRTSLGAQETSRANPVHFASIALRGVGQVVDMQMTAARVLLQTQARAAAAFGWPDCSDLFDSADERARHVFSTSAEKVLETAQRANEAVTELQRQVGRVVETQAAAATEQWQRGIEELGSQTQQGIVQLCEAARQSAEEAAQATQSLSDAANETRRQGEQVLQEAQAAADERIKRNKAA
jgi:hypothetical protein